MTNAKYAVIGEQLCWPCYYTWLEGDNVPATFESEADARAEIQDYLEEWMLTRTEEQLEDGDTPEDFQVFRVEIEGKNLHCYDPFSGKHSFTFDWTAQL